MAELHRTISNRFVGRSGGFLDKSYALAGLRFGYVVAQPHVIEQLNKVKDSYNCDSLSIAAATAAISDQVWLQENRRKILATREKLTLGLEQLGFQVIPSQANFVWCTHPRGGHREIYFTRTMRPALLPATKQRVASQAGLVEGRCRGQDVGHHAVPAHHIGGIDVNDVARAKREAVGQQHCVG